MPLVLLPVYCKEFGKISPLLKHKTHNLSGNTHLFMKEEGVDLCDHCNAKICSYCTVSKQQTIMCLACYASTNACSDLSVTKGVTAMKHTLMTKFNINNANDLSTTEVVDFNKELERSWRSIKLVAVKYQLYNSNHFDKSEKENVPFSFSDGAYFLKSNQLTNKDVAHIIRILVAFVTYSHIENNNKKLHEQALLDLICNVCNESCADGGICLMKRANHHTMDPQSTSILSFSGNIKFKDRVPSLSIEGKVNVSMKDSQYECSAVFNHMDLLCCSCTCKCGSFADDRVLVL